MKIKFLVFMFLNVTSFALSLAPVGGGTQARCMALIPACMGDMNNVRTNDYCIHCQTMNQGIFPSYTSPVPAYYPWWYGYGQYQYPNFNYPGYWQGGGLSNHYYPGPGNMAAGKPNIYFHGLSDKEASEFWFQIKYAKDANELASSPIHTNDGWKISYKDGSYVVDGAKYPYIYYDYKLNSAALQNEKGFCGERFYIYEKMVSVLNTMKFKDSEISDFENYWAFKIPKGEFCVYPQDHENLSPIAQWNSSIQPRIFKRVLFVIIPKEQIEAKVAANFVKAPKEDWKPVTGIYRNTAATESRFQIHEWGVAFLTK